MTVPPDSQIAGWVSGLYTGPVGFDHIVQVDQFAPYVGIKVLPDGTVLIVPRGSKTWQDWFRDLDSERFRVIAGYEAFGEVPAGFGDFAAETFAAISALVDPNAAWIVGCHSLGCPEGVYQALMKLMSGGKVAKIVLCAPPNPGTPALTALLASFQVPVSAYWNKGDTVPAFPLPAPVLKLSWEPAYPFRFIKQSPRLDDLDLLFRCHNMALYLAGIAAYEATRPS